MIDVTVPTDKNIYLKEFQRLSKYKDLEIEFTKLWKLKTKTISKLKTKTISVVTGALSVIKKST